jgi:hypothetical protein
LIDFDPFCSVPKDHFGAGALVFFIKRGQDAFDEVQQVPDSVTNGHRFERRLIGPFQADNLDGMRLVLRERFWG